MKTSVAGVEARAPKVRMLEAVTGTRAKVDYSVDEADYPVAYVAVD